MAEHEGEVRWRLWVDGPHLVADDWLPRSDPLRPPPEHTALVAAAQEAGLVWLAEMFDPALPEDEAYYRIGTDRAGMVDPLEVPGTGPEVN